MINVKSNYSLLSSLLKIDDIISYAKKTGSLAAFLSDNSMYGVMEFYKKCQKENIKPIIGLNVNYEEFRINLYAKNYKGYQNLIKLTTIINKEILTKDDLKKYNSDLICVLYFEYKNSYEELSDIYENIYLGYTNKEEEIIAKTITKDVIFFRECLYLTKEDNKYLPYLYRIRDGKTLSDDINYDVLNHELDLDNILEFTSNTGLMNIEKIINECNLVFPKNNLLLPIYHPKNNVSPKDYLTSLATTGLKKRLGRVDEKYLKRLNYELKIINEMGFCNYFLVVYDFIYYAKKNNILVGPGRGSAAGSLVAYSIGITEIDPIKYDLLFERFLNPERKTMPDIDTDFPDDKRDLVINYVREKYGEDHVAGIVTFGTMMAKLVLRDVARVLNIPLYKVDSLTKLIPSFNRDKLIDIYNKNINFKSRVDSDKSLQRLLKIASKFEGFPRHTSSHAAGIIMSEVPLDEVIPLTVSDGMNLSAYTMEYLEELGLLKMDFLGLKNLSILANIINDVNKEYNKNINFYDIELNDKNVLKLFSDADTIGIFQFESNGMRNFLHRLKPEVFEDIFAAIALFRPGAAINIDSYIRRRHKMEEVTYPDKSLEPILKNTYGIIVYQEQVIEVANVFAGYTLGDADILRRAMSKKKFNILKMEEEKFIKKSIEKGHDYNTAKKIFDLILKFAGYGFNRSHSVAYSMIAYRLAYFKVYYKEIFYSNLLNNTISYPEKTHEYITEAKSKNIKIEKPNINISSTNYVVKDNTIYLPFSILSSVGSVASRQIIKARDTKPFIDVYDTISRLVREGVSKKTIEALIYIGALKIFDYNIRTLIDNLDNLMNYANLTKDLDESLVMKPDIVKKEEFDKVYLLELEKELLGFYLTHHPTTRYMKNLNNIVNLKDIKSYLNKTIKTVALVEKIKIIKTKKKDDMAFLTGSDETKRIDYILFPKIYAIYNYIEKGNIILIEGTVEKRLDNLQIIVNKIDILNGDKNE